MTTWPALRGHHAPALVLMLASGFAGLGYQIVWARQGALWLGQESAAVLAVVAAFFGGMALGAWALGRRIDRSARPARWYAACELMIGAWGAVLLFALAPACDALLAATGHAPGALQQWAVAFAGTLVLLLPATAAMGATLPALARWLTGDLRGGGTVAGLYAANTLGAVVGVLATAFWLLPAYGLRATAGLCIALNLACAALAWGWPARPTPAFPPALPPAVPVAAGGGGLGVLLVLAITGALAIGYEVVVVRVLSQVFENTVYTFALVLAVYLAGSALGAAAYARAVRRGCPPSRTALLLSLSAACLVGLGGLWLAVPARDAVAAALAAVLDDRLLAALAAEAAVALLAFGAPTLVMGALFSHLADAARAAGHGLGRALAWNTLGAALAPPTFGVWALPLGGAQPALLAIAAGYVALARPWRSPWPWAAAGAAVATAALSPALVIVDLPPGARLLSHREGPTATVSVIEDGQGVRSLHIDNRQQEGSNATGLADGRQALLPLLLHAAPRRALFLGVGTGVTAATAAAQPGLTVDAVELLPEVLDTWLQFNPPDAPRPHLHAADARRFVRSTAQRYDVVVADNVHPARSGTGTLYTVEHFGAVRARLAAGGLFCQWLPLHQLDAATLRSIVRSFQAVFPEAQAVLATHSLLTPVLGLIGRAGPARLDPTALRTRLAMAGDEAADFGFHDEWALLGSFVAGPAGLARLAGDAALNTDDHPVVSHLAPRHTYAPAGTPGDQLLMLLAGLEVQPRDLLDDGSSAALHQRLAAYGRARLRFLQAGRRVQPTSDVRQMLAQVREPLLQVLRISPDFQAASAPLLQMARALARVDPAAARALLDELHTLRPGDTAIEQALRQLGAG
jgi:spermidine synthase